MKAILNRLGIILVSLIPLSLVIYLISHKRAYYLISNDNEPDYFYNGALVASGEMPKGVHHPGTPAYYLFGGILRLLSSHFIDWYKSAQLIFNISYVVIGFIFFVILMIFALSLREKLNFGIFSFGVLAPLAFFPSLLFLNSFSSDSFIMPIAYLLLINVIAMDELRRPWYFYSVCCGFICALGIAIKLTFIPIAIGGFLSLMPQLLKEMSQDKKYIRFLGRFLLAPLVSYVFFTFIVRVFTRGNQNLILMSFFERREASNVGYLHWISSFIHSQHYFQLLMPGYYLFLIFLLALFCATFFLKKIKVLTLLKYRSQIIFIFASVGTYFLYVSLLGVGSTNSQIEMYENSARLRNALVSLILFPAITFFLFDLIRSYRKAYLAFSVIAAIISFTGLFLNFTSFFKSREAWMNSVEARVHMGGEFLKKNIEENKSIALWTDGPGAFGSRGFHLWGNYRYANSFFDRQIYEADTRLVTFRFRRMGDLLRDLKSGALSAYRDDIGDRYNLLTNKLSHEKINILLIEDDSETRNIPFHELEIFIKKYFPFKKYSKVKLDGTYHRFDLQ